MRTSNPFATRGRRRGSRPLAASLIVMGLVVAACGSPPASGPSATPMPTPVVTPNPQMTDPASADALFTAIVSAGLPISANNAVAGKDPVKQINATYRDWPMRISEYASAASLAKARPWKSGVPPGKKEPPVAIAGLNILIEWGTATGAVPAALDEAQVNAMNELLQVIHPYIGPLRVRTTTKLAVPVATQAPTPKPSASAGTSAPPSKKPKASP